MIARRTSVSCFDYMPGEGGDVHKDRDCGDIQWVYGEHEDNTDNVPNHAIRRFLREKSRMGIMRRLDEAKHESRRVLSHSRASRSP